MQSRHLGMTIVELSLSMLLISIIFVLTVPGIITSSTLNTALYRAKNMSKDLASAEQVYSAQAQSGTTPSAANLAGDTKFAGVQTSGIFTGTNAVPGPTCSTANPCYLYADGGVLYPGFASGVSAPTFVNTALVAPIGFTYDPDGNGNLPPATFIIDWNTNRITSYDAFCTDTTNVQNCGSTKIDPAYIKIWTQM